MGLPGPVTVGSRPGPPGPRSQGRLTRVVVAGPEPKSRIRLVARLAARRHIEVVGEAEDCIAATELAVTRRPDLAILDVHLPDLLDACRWIERTANTVQIVVVRTDEGKGPIPDAVRTPSGAMLEVWSLEGFLDATRGLRNGGSGLDPFTARSALATIRCAPNTGDPAPPRLTARELQVLELRAQGTPVRQLAMDLYISVNTVKAHLRNIHVNLQSKPTT